MSEPEASLPTSPYFRLERLGEGIFHAIATPGSGSLGNAGIIDLGAETLIFDTMLTAAAARDLRAAAERLTGRAPRYVVNSHFHADHTIGNIAFDDATIIATTPTAERFANENDQFLRELREQGAELDAQARAEAAAVSDSAVRRDMEEQNDDFAALMREAHTTRSRRADITFESQLTIHGAHRAVRLISWGGGHTASDAVLYLPTERILFTGDLIFHRCHASISDSDPTEWLRILGEMERLDIATLAPGHGAVASRTAITEQRAYLEAMLALALQAVEAGKVEEEAVAASIPLAYRDYGFASGFAHTLRALMKYQRARLETSGTA
ncbi:MAG TPA: MBL fold metallo-hydrolase [Ktedonobacterales bacterium]|jgi:glyoxylase-like metal-dependent hydrolase (beta-lactamase superfamily II)